MTLIHVEKQDEMISANKEIQNAKENCHLQPHMFGQNDKSGPHREPMAKHFEQIQTRQKKMLQWHRIWKMIKMK